MQGWRVSKFARAEQVTLRRTRCAVAMSGDAAVQDGSLDATFVRLAEVCAARKFQIADPKSSYVTLDERLLLYAIALRQRSSSKLEEFALHDVGEVLAACAVALLATGQRLRFNSITLALLRDNHWLASVAVTGPVQDVDSSTLRAPVVTARYGSLKWSVIEHVRSRARVSSAELQALGISRQYISMLRREGVLEYVTFGYYRLGIAAGAPRPQ